MKKKLPRLIYLQVGNKWFLGTVIILLKNSSRIINIPSKTHSIIFFGVESVADGELDRGLFRYPIFIDDFNHFNIIINFIEKNIN